MHVAGLHGCRVDGGERHPTYYSCPLQRIRGGPARRLPATAYKHLRGYANLGGVAPVLILWQGCRVAGLTEGRDTLHITLARCSRIRGSPARRLPATAYKHLRGYANLGGVAPVLILWQGCRVAGLTEGRDTLHITLAAAAHQGKPGSAAARNCTRTPPRFA